MEIIVDDRERAVVPYLDDVSDTFNIPYKIQRNEVGDYAVVYKGYILLIIERKTWVDLSASFRDGRKSNIQKLLEVREKTGCQIGYLIEGDATPRLDKKFGRLPLKNLRAHLDHLAFRDGVHIFYSKDQEYTATRLFELAQNYLSMKEIISDIDKMEALETEDIAELKNKPSCSVVNHNEQLLKCIPGIGSIVAPILAEAGITLVGCYNELHEVEFIATLKYASGAMIGTEKAKKIAGVKKIINSTAERSKKTHIKLLTTIPLISKATAIRILEQVTLADIMSDEIELETLAALNRTEKTRLGVKAAQNIINHMVEGLHPAIK